MSRGVSWILVSMSLCVATAASADRAYVPDDPIGSLGTVSVIDTVSNTVVKTITVGARPRTVAVSPQSKRVYITNQGDPSGGFGTGSVSVIDGNANTVIATIAVNSPFGIAANASRVFVASATTNLVTAISAASNTVVGSVLIPGGIPAAGVGAEPIGLAVSPSGARVYSANFIDKSVSVIDTASMTIVARVGLTDQPQAIAINPSGTRVYTANINSISVIDTASNTVVASIAGTAANGQGNSQGVAVNPAGTLAYVTNQITGKVTVVSTASNTVTGVISVGGSPLGVSFTGDGRRAYVVDLALDNVHVVDVASAGVIANVAVGSAPEAVGSFILPGCLHNRHDFNGDGRTDRMVFRQPTAQWFNLDGPNAVIGVANQHDLPVSADYDGDCKADHAVWNPANGDWTILLSSTGAPITRNWGLGSVGDIPVPGDYDGDGIADLAVFRQPTGQWFVKSIAGAINNVSFGVAGQGDIPVQGDYDGDGRTDMAYWVPSTGAWNVRLSATGAVLPPVSWGLGSVGDVPVPGDYDGDGKSDRAVYRQPTGQWFVQASGGGSPSTVFGVAGQNDVPVPGDYDGDGKTDFAYWNPVPGTWNWLQSSTGTPASTSWGTSTVGDIPVPAPSAYLRSHY